MMEARNLCKAYRGIPVLQNVSFTADLGVTCVMAPSGSGKTTLLRILLGVETADSGTVSSVENCRWAAVFQEDRLLEQLDAMGNLRFVLGPSLNTAKAAAMLDELGLGEVGAKPVREFSGGMKRRLALARALIAPSDALALDEPFTGLDGENRVRALACVHRAAEEKMVILVTHDPRDAIDLSARTVELA
jgi:NitT/TauT family transport system ATP-binding protein